MDGRWALAQRLAKHGSGAKRHAGDERVETVVVERGAIAGVSTGAQLDRLAGGLRRARSLDEVNARHEARSLSWLWGEDGPLVLRGRFSPEEGALVIAALEAARDSMTEDAPDASAEAATMHRRRLAGQANADAMVMLAETMLASGPAPAPGGERQPFDQC